MSKNRIGGLKQLRVKNKAGERCHVYIIDLYLSKLPEAAFVRDNFYVQPLCNNSIPVDPGKPWFTANPIGRNSLSKIVKEVCVEGGISGNKTNHSLRATGASHMYQAGVPEKLIQETTGHLSTSGVRQYERSTIDQQRAVSRILSSGASTSTYEAELRSVQNETVVNETVVPTELPPVAATQHPSAPMHFSGCTVTIYNAPPTSS